MPEKWFDPGAASSARGRGCLAGWAGSLGVAENRHVANAVALDLGDGEVRSITGQRAKLVRQLAQAGPGGLRLSGPDLELAEALAVDGVPLLIGERDAKGRAGVGLDPTQVEEVRHVV